MRMIACQRGSDLPSGATFPGSTFSALSMACDSVIFSANENVQRTPPRARECNTETCLRIRWGKSEAVWLSLLLADVSSANCAHRETCEQEAKARKISYPIARVMCGVMLSKGTTYE